MNITKKTKNTFTRFVIGISTFAIALTLIATPSAHAQVLERQLQVGMSGNDISQMQAFLAKDISIYPQGLVTGYFGFLTKAAVSNFQERNNISPVGRVGPVTLPVLNAQMAGNMIPPVLMTGNAPIFSGLNIGTSSNSASVSWSTNENTKGVVYYSTSPLSTYEMENSVTVSGSTVMMDANFRTSHSVSISGLQPNTTYYYLIYSTNQMGNVSVTWPTTFITTN